jgi:predicted dehydrogenase
MRIGIIGCGGIAGQHIRGYEACEDVEISAGADVDIQRAIDVAGEDHAHTSFHEMLSNEQLDAVSVCTPPKFHKDAVCAALEAGVHVLCEKPLGFHAADAREMVECAERTGKLLVTAFCHRFHEPVMHARELIRAGKIGKVTMFRNRFGGKADMTKVWFSNPEISGGGTVPDTSIHSIDLFRYLVGNPIKVSGAVATADSRYKVEDCSVIVLQTRDGAIGTIEASWTSPGSANIIEIYGTDGAIVVDYTRPNVRFLASGSSDWEEIENSQPDRFVLQAQHFVDCVRNGTKPVVDGLDGLRANEIADTVYEFNRAGGCGWANV